MRVRISVAAAGPVTRGSAAAPLPSATPMMPTAASAPHAAATGGVDGALAERVLLGGQLRLSLGAALFVVVLLDYGVGNGFTRRNGDTPQCDSPLFFPWLAGD